MEMNMGKFSEKLVETSGACKKEEKCTGISGNQRFL